MSKAKTPPRLRPQDPTRPLKDARHERFAQERAGGCSIVEAYERAGFSRRWGNAKKMNAYPAIQARIAHLQAEHAERKAETVDRTVDRLDRAYELAMTERQCAAAVSAAMGIAKVLGLIVEKQEQRITGDLTVEIVKFADEKDD